MLYEIEIYYLWNGGASLLDSKYIRSSKKINTKTKVVRRKDYKLIRCITEYNEIKQK